MSGWKKPDTKPKGYAWLRLAALILLLGAGAVLLWQNGYIGRPAENHAAKEPAPLAGTGETPAPTAVSQRSLREEAYDKDIAALTALFESEGTDTQTREDAARQLQKMVEAHQIEVGIEEALKAAGFSPCLTLLQNGSLTVMVEATELTSAQSATILSLCAAHSHMGVENIRIMTGEK